MIGNAGEWTCSVYNAVYKDEEQKCAPLNDSRSRVLRGGDPESGSEGVRVAARSGVQPSKRHWDIYIKSLMNSHL